jgi:hypothetical protein
MTNDLELAAWEACGGRRTEAQSWWYFPNGSRILMYEKRLRAATMGDPKLFRAWVEGDFFAGPVRGVDDWSKSPF